MALKLLNEAILNSLQQLELMETGNVLNKDHKYKDCTKI